MTKLPSVTFVVGTRPEAIKLAPVIKQFQACDALETRIILSGQHKDLVLQVFNLFEISADDDLDVLLPGQSLACMTSSILQRLRDEFCDHRPELVFVQGDTTTAFSAALAACYEKIPIAHVEAGLRTFDLSTPFPEEINRILISQIANINFAPTLQAEKNLKHSSILGKIVLTGNTVIDSLLFVDKHLTSLEPPFLGDKNCRLILVTVHRRENWGEGLYGVIEGLRKILELHLDVVIVLPLHCNPTVRQPIESFFGNHPRVKLLDPMKYHDLISFLLKNHNIQLFHLLL